jgi:hypothetical protein
MRAVLTSINPDRSLSSVAAGELQPFAPPPVDAFVDRVEHESFGVDEGAAGSPNDIGELCAGEEGLTTAESVEQHDGCR